MYPLSSFLNGNTVQKDKVTGHRQDIDTDTSEDVEPPQHRLDSTGCPFTVVPG